MNNQFSRVAQEYDGEFTSSLIGKAQRDVVWRMLKRWLPNRKLNILETNCGTGVDALYLLKKGHHVTASDYAEEMLKITEKRLTENAEQGFSVLQWDLRKPFPVSNKTYDVVFSNFGGWNCLDALQILSLSASCSKILAPGGKIIAVVMGRKCIWEKWYFRNKGDKQKSKRRKSKDAVVAALGNGNFVETWYYSPDELITLFPDFKFIMKQPVGMFIPPSYLNPFFKNKKWLLAILVALERLFGFALFSNYADHYIIALEKR